MGYRTLASNILILRSVSLRFLPSPSAILSSTAPTHKKKTRLFSERSTAWRRWRHDLFARRTYPMFKIHNLYHIFTESFETSMIFRHIHDIPWSNVDNMQYIENMKSSNFDANFWVLQLQQLNLYLGTHSIISWDKKNNPWRAIHLPVCYLHLHHLTCYTCCCLHLDCWMFIAKLIILDSLQRWYNHPPATSNHSLHGSNRVHQPGDMFTKIGRY